MQITPSSSSASSRFISPVANASLSANMPVSDTLPLPLVAEESQAGPSRPGEGQGGSIERNLRRAAADIEQASGSAQAAQPLTKKQRLEEAKARLKEKKQASRKETLQDRNGVTTEHEKRALAAGFTKEDGTPDIATYKRHVVEQSARNYTDAAGNHPFRNADGTGDNTAYSRHITEQSAKNYTDAAGNHPFRNADGTVDMTAYQRHVTEQSARNYTDAAGNHPFRKADGTGDRTAYKRHVTEQSARNYTDAAGNHPFRNADGTGNVTAYNRAVSNNIKKPTQ